MKRRSFFALLAGAFGARKLPAALKPGDRITMAVKYAINPVCCLDCGYTSEDDVIALYRYQRSINSMIAEAIELAPNPPWAGPTPEEWKRATT